MRTGERRLVLLLGAGLLCAGAAPSSAQMTTDEEAGKTQKLLQRIEATEERIEASERDMRALKQELQQMRAELLRGKAASRAPEEGSGEATAGVLILVCTRREVRARCAFPQGGISYIFCNIHPEMGAVVIALNTSLWSIGRADGRLLISGVPPGTYQAHLWVEGETERRLAEWTHVVHIRDHEKVIDAGAFQAGAVVNPEHLNKFGRPYEHDLSPY